MRHLLLNAAVFDLRELTQWLGRDLLGSESWALHNLDAANRIPAQKGIYTITQLRSFMGEEQSSGTISMNEKGCRFGDRLSIGAFGSWPDKPTGLYLSVILLADKFGPSGEKISTGKSAFARDRVHRLTDQLV